MATRPIASLVDDFLAAAKEVRGVPTWRPTGHHGQHRLVCPLFVGGESVGATLDITAYPNQAELQFTINLIFERCIWRLEHGGTEQHTNSLDAPHDLMGAVLDGPHYHSWADNRRFSTRRELPKRLHNARLTDPEIASFEAALEWFCRQTSIVTPPPGVIVWPRRDELF